MSETQLAQELLALARQAGTAAAQLGLAVYSPRLDQKGNSIRGIKVCMDLADELGLHAFDCMNHGSDYLKAIL